VCNDELGCVSYRRDELIRLAAALVLSGPFADLGLDSQFGIELAIASRGEVAGRSMELQIEDGGCNSEGGQRAGQMIVADPTILGVIGTSCSSSALPMSGLISEAGYFMVSPSNTAPGLTDPAVHWNPGYLRTAHNDLFQATIVAEYAFSELGIRHAAAIQDGNPYTVSLAMAFAEAFESLGGEIVITAEVSRGEADMRTAPDSVAAGPPEFLYCPVFPPECDVLTLQAREVVGLEETVLAGSDGCFFADSAEAMEDAASGLLLNSAGSGLLRALLPGLHRQLSGHLWDGSAFCVQRPRLRRR
jgi:branched-chain amino acid transport system substrate-binding protein